MTKKISNTLTRWHKVAERVKVAATEMSQKNLQTVMGSRNLDADTFAVRRANLRAASVKATGEQTVLFFKLQRTLFQIRRALAKANVQFGVSDLLSNMEEAKQAMNYYTTLLGATEGALSEDEFASLAGRKNAAQNMYGVSVTFISAEQIASLTEDRDALKREVNALADRLSDANASKLSLDIDDDVVKAIGL